jgi:phage baseplate assembly protein W
VALRITDLEQIADRYSVKPYLYKDIHIDFKTSETHDVVLQKAFLGNDVKVDFDYQAIINSLRNLFNTKPGERFLFPLYGLDLNQFLFDPITNNNAISIGERIVSAVEKYEPRVKILKCIVTPDPDQNTYELAIFIEIPIFNTQAALNATFDIKYQNFIFLETDNNK